MTCGFSKELLALHVENDLPETDGRIVARHLQDCVECSSFFDQLSHRQSQLKMLRHETIPQSTFTRIRHEVLSRIENAPQSLGWSVRVERTLWLGFRRHAFVFTSLAIAAVSATLFAQMRQPATPNATMNPKHAAVFAEGNTLIRPAGYREWISIGSSMAPGVVTGPHLASTSSASSARLSRNVYVDRSAYLTYSETGKFPEGAVLIVETSGTAGERPASMAVSVKDSRFDGGWGFFDFTNPDGSIKDKAQLMPGKSSCRTCHEEHAKNDHVFTQFPPGLKTAT